MKNLIEILRDIWESLSVLVQLVLVRLSLLDKIFILSAVVLIIFFLIILVQDDCMNKKNSR